MAWLVVAEVASFSDGDCDFFFFEASFFVALLLWFAGIRDEEPSVGSGDLD